MIVWTGPRGQWYLRSFAAIGRSLMLAIRRCKAVDIEFPVLIAAAAKPIDAVVVPLISKAHCNTVLTQSPDLFDQPVVAFVVPFAGQESDDSLTAYQKFSPVSPIAPLRGDLTLHHRPRPEDFGGRERSRRQPATRPRRLKRRRQSLLITSPSIWISSQASAWPT